jgi:ribonuclease D
MPRRAPKPIPVAALPETLVTDPSQLATCLERIAASDVIGFDTEFVGEDSYRPELCLIQVATPEHLFVIDPFGTGPLDEFWNLLLDPARTTIVHAGREDIRICQHQTGYPPANVFDVQLAAGLVGHSYPIGYGALVFDLLGQRMAKGQTLTDWRRRPLSPAQIRYAFDDVLYLIPSWRKLSEKLKRLKRTDWAAEEFAAAVVRATSEEAAGERWRKVKGLGGLDRRGLAIARELFQWREAFGERVNRPARQLLRDDVLAEIARRGPTRHEDLAAFRGVPAREVSAILDAVRRAKALPPETHPEPEARENDPPHVLLLGSFLGVVLADWCIRNRLAANLVASVSDLRSLVRSRVDRQPLSDLPLSRGWRARAVLPELEEILSGKRAVRVENLRSSAPLDFIPVVEGGQLHAESPHHPPGDKLPEVEGT